MQIPESTTFPAELQSIEGEQHLDRYTGLLYQVKDGVPVPVWEHYSWVGWLLCEALKQHQGTLKADLCIQRGLHPSGDHRDNPPPGPTNSTSLRHDLSAGCAGAGVVSHWRSVMYTKEQPCRCGFTGEGLHQCHAGRDSRDPSGRCPNTAVDRLLPTAGVLAGMQTKVSVVVTHYCESCLKEAGLS